MIIKRYSIQITIILVSFFVSAVIFLDSSDFRIFSNPAWSYKENEIRSRLLEIPILLYHNIDGRGVYSVSLEKLRSHFQLFREKGVKVLRLTELVNRLENPRPFNSRGVVITFDDGFISMYSKLLPLAREFNYPVTLFVYTDFISSRGKKTMTWKLLREMDRDLVDIQVHSKSHADLTEIIESSSSDRYQRLYEEIYLCKRVTELYLDKKVRFYAFPYGRYNLSLVELSRNAGYHRVFSTDFGPNIVTRNNFCLKRHHILNTYTLEYIEGLVN
jgi:peptidoglycan/xylan/chitin deacetylase (PgdA/CDA1 family)